MDIANGKFLVSQVDEIAALYDSGTAPDLAYDNEVYAKYAYTYSLDVLDISDWYADAERAYRKS